MTAFLEIYC